MAQRLRCPSGRSPFCQLRKDKRCRCNIGYKTLKKTPTKPRCSLPERRTKVRTALDAAVSDEERQERERLRLEEGQRSGEEHPPRVAPEGDMEVEEGADGSAMEPVEQESDFVQRFKRPPNVAIEDLENEIKESSINRHALDLVVSLDDQGHQELVSLMGSWCYLLICSFLH